MDAPAPAPLEHLDESWERALCIVAHPDDMEFGAAAAAPNSMSSGCATMHSARSQLSSNNAQGSGLSML